MNVGLRTGPVSVLFDFEDHVPTRSVAGSACAAARPADSSSVDNILSMADDCERAWGMVRRKRGVEAE